MMENLNFEWLKQYTKLFTPFQHVSHIFHWHYMVIFISLFVEKFVGRLITYNQVLGRSSRFYNLGNL